MIFLFKDERKSSSDDSDETLHENNSSSSRPKTRRGRDLNFNGSNETNDDKSPEKIDAEIWRPPSRNEKENSLHSDRKNSSSTENQFKDWYPDQ